MARGASPERPDDGPRRDAGARRRVDGDVWMTIDRLAAESDMTVRNIRAHQSRGLLPPPRIEGRTGYYGPVHLRRLNQIRRLQDEGLNLATIAKVLVDGSLTAAASGPFVEEGELVEAGELLARLGLDVSDPAVARAVADGLIRFEGDRVRVESPRLLAAAEELVALGVPLLAQLDAVEVVQQASASVAEAFLGLADEHLLARLAVETQADPDRVAPVVGSLRLVAAGVLDVLFDRAMSVAIREYFESGPEGPVDQSEEADVGERSRE